MVDFVGGYKPVYSFFSKKKLEKLSGMLSTRLRKIITTESGNEAEAQDYKRTNYFVDNTTDSKVPEKIRTKGTSTKDIKTAIKRMSGGDPELEKILAVAGGQQFQARISKQLVKKFKCKNKPIVPLCFVSPALFCKEKNYLNYYSIQLIYVIQFGNYFYKVDDAGKLIKIIDDEVVEINKKIKSLNEEIKQIDLADAEETDVLSAMLLIQKKLEQELGKPIVMGGEQTVIVKETNLKANIKDIVLVSNANPVKIREAKKIPEEIEQEKIKIEKAEKSVDSGIQNQKFESESQQILKADLNLPKEAGNQEQIIIGTPDGNTLTENNLQNTTQKQPANSKCTVRKIIEEIFNVILSKIRSCQTASTEEAATKAVYPNLLARTPGSINYDPPATPAPTTSTPCDNPLEYLLYSRRRSL